MTADIQIFIDGTLIDQLADELILVGLQPYMRDGYPVLNFVKPIRSLLSGPHPWDAKEVKLYINDVLIFTGDTSRQLIHYDDTFGWVFEWTAIGLANRASWVPVTDQNTLTDTVRFNTAKDDPSDLPARDGRSIGQMVMEVLSMKQTSARLQAYGVGNYSSLGQGATAKSTILAGHLDTITITNAGSGYTAPPAVRFSGGGGSGAAGTVVVSGGAVTGISITNPGSGYTTPPIPVISTLPDQTLADLDQLTIIPPYEVSVAGEHVLQMLEGIVQAAHPNHHNQVQADGTIRFLDPRVITSATINVVLNKPNDPNSRWSMPTITCDWSQCFTNVVLRGSSRVVSATLQTLPWPGSSAPDGGLINRFEHDGLTNAQAIALWSPTDFTTPLQSPGTSLAHANVSSGTISSIGIDNPGYNYQSAPTVLITDSTGTGATATATLGSGTTAGQVASIAVTSAGSGYSSTPTVTLTGPAVGQSDIGICTMPSTTQVSVTSSNTHANWVADYWDQTSGNHAGTVILRSDILSGYQQYYTSPIIANTALVPGGTSMLTLQVAAPAVSYNSYQIFGTAGGASYVWRRYGVTDPTIAAQMTNYFPYPVAYTNSDGTAATMTSTAQAVVMYSPNGQPPYRQLSVGVNVDPTSGTILLSKPSALIFSPDGKTVVPPTNVQVFLPINTGELSTVWPPDSGGLPTYDGTAFTRLGIQRTKYISVPAWTDYSQSANMIQYAKEYHGACSNIVYEGTIHYNGLIESALHLNQMLSITGDGYVTGLEGILLPIVACNITFNQRASGGSLFEMDLTFSTRRTPFSGAVFQRPAMRGEPLGFAQGMAGMSGMQIGMQGWQSALAQTYGQGGTVDRMAFQAEQTRAMAQGPSAFERTMMGEMPRTGMEAGGAVDQSMAMMGDMGAFGSGEEMTMGEFSRQHGGVGTTEGNATRVNRTIRQRHAEEKQRKNSRQEARKAQDKRVTQLRERVSRERLARGDTGTNQATVTTIKPQTQQDVESMRAMQASSRSLNVLPSASEIQLMRSNNRVVTDPGQYTKNSPRNERGAERNYREARQQEYRDKKESEYQQRLADRQKTMRDEELSWDAGGG